MSSLLDSLQRCAATGFRVEIYCSEGYLHLSLLQEATTILEASMRWPDDEVIEEDIDNWLCAYW